MLYILTPFILLIANIINSPIERIIKKKYINEAKKIINSHRDITVIGITGSYGKTSVKNFLYSFLSEKYNVLKTPKNYNTTMGVVKTIRENLKSTHEIFICEMGATHKGDIDEICGIVNPKIGILTGIAPIHLETFKTLDTLLSTKLELANYVKKLYYNKDNKELKTAVPKNSIGYSVNDVNGIKMSSDGTIFGNYKTSLIGKSNIQNLLGSIKVAQNEFNITENEINNALRTIRPIMHRQELKTVDIRTNIIDDAYNSNPIGSKAALDTLSMFNYDYKIVITPGMIDLGKRQEIENYKFGQNISNIADFVILVGAKWTLPIKQAFVDNNFTEYKIYNTMESAINYAMSIKAKKHKTILIENDLPDNYL
jgi:UDP-N-acetylmuramoyl-tripeptide--D-alanyl-D-alanine ligase